MSQMILIFKKKYYLHLAIMIFLFTLQSPVFADGKTQTKDSLRLEKYLSKLKSINPQKVDSIIIVINQGVTEFKKENKTYNLCKINQAGGSLFSKFGYLNLSEIYYSEALELAKQLKNKKLEANILNSYGVLWGKKGDYIKAESIFLKALLIAKQNNDAEGTANSYFKLGVIRTKQDKPDEALKFYLKIESINKLNGSKYYQKDLIQNLGIVYAMKGDLSNALNQFHKSYNNALKHNNYVDQVLALQNIGLVFKEKKDYLTADKSFKEGIALAKKQGLKEEELRISLSRTLILFDQKKYDLAQNQLINLLNEGKKIELEDLEIEIYNNLEAIAKVKQNYKSALYYFKKNCEVKDKQLNQQKQQAVAEANASLGLYKANEEVLEGKNLLFQKIKEKNIILGGLIFAGLVSIGLIIVLYRLKRLNVKLNHSKLELTNSNNIKNKLFSIIGHDLRGSYGMTLGILELIKEDELTEAEQQKYLDLVIKQSESSLTILDDLLLWGQAQIKGTKLNQLLLPVLPTVQKSINFNIEAINDKCLTVNKIDLENKNVFMDANHFAFVIRNLLANSIKFTPKNGEINIYAQDYGEGLIRICVADNGIGISTEDLKNVFLPDSKSSLGTNSEKGTGLGLTLCNEFVKANGGEIWAEKNADQGTIICFTCLKG
jgi:signal transduction histidine kinase